MNNLHLLNSRIARRATAILAGCALCAAALCLPIIAGAAAPANGLKEGWQQVDQRMVFLTVELSTVESTISAANKALRVNGYQQAIRQAAADQAAKGNERMDRNGGGPVSWQEFYGKTASSFFYHPADNEVSVTTGGPDSNRPPQFDYIYRANVDSQQKAMDDVARIGDKIDDLLAYRRTLETEQSALWGKIAFRGVSTLDIATRPLYQLDLSTTGSDKSSKEALEAVRGGVAFMRAVDTELTAAQTSIDNDQKAAIDRLLDVTITGRAALQATLLQLTSLADAAANPQSTLGQFGRAAKRLQDSAQNMVDAYRLASDSDSKRDDAGKQIYRGQLQQMLMDYASTVVTADQMLTRFAAESKLTMAAAPRGTSPAQPVAGDIAGQLDAAKDAHGREVAAAKRGLLAALDTRINAAADAGDLAQVKAIQAAQRKAAADGSLPDGFDDPVVLSARTQMQSSIAAADARLAAAYREAIKSFTKARRFAEAEAAGNEFNASGLPGSSTAGSAPAAAVDGADQPVSGGVIVISAQWGGGNHWTDVTDQVQQLVAAGKDFLASSGILKRDPTPGWRKQLKVVYKLDGKRRTAFVSEDSLFKIPVSTATAQVPRPDPSSKGDDAAPAAETATVVPSSVPIYRLSSNLPSAFASAEPFINNRSGIVLREFIRTRRTDFLSQDFVMDVWFVNQKDGEPVMVGIGGAGDPDSDDHTSVSIVVNPPENMRGEVTVAIDRYGKGTVGHVPEAGLQMVRMEKHGDEVKFFVGGEEDGKFVADISTTVANIKDCCNILNGRNTHLFFGHRHLHGANDGNVTFTKVRLYLIGPSAKDPEP